MLPKQKFQVGDTVKCVVKNNNHKYMIGIQGSGWNIGAIFIIYKDAFNDMRKEWAYRSQHGYYVQEKYLELVEKGK